MPARLLRTAYGLHTYEWGSWTLERWLNTVLLGLAAVLAVLGVPRLAAGEWLSTAAPVLLLMLLVLLLRAYARWAAAQGYLVFEPETGDPPPGCALVPADKVLIHATGQFEVQGKSHFFSDLLAYWRTFATREHAVMAIVHRTRFLAVGAMPDALVGMWYIFWCPEAMVDLQPGQVVFGLDRRFALRVRYNTPEMSADERRRLPLWQRRRKFSRVETVYLSFDDEASRQRVWADLLADANP